MNIVYSPCPNDTFVFHALVHGQIANTPDFTVTYADIDVTNTLVTKPSDYDILKISYAALPWLSDEYRLIPCGGALGRGNGPLVLTAHQNTSPEDLAGKRIAVPSERSTAYLLFRLWAAQNVPDGIGEIVVMPFDQIMPAVRDGKVDAGLVIHEARFTYPSYGLTLMADMGTWWEADTKLPIPLGAIVAHRSLDPAEITAWIQASIDYGWKHPEQSREYILSHAQEMDPAVAQQHINLYVNEFTRNLGEEGFGAIEALLGRAAAEGLVPEMDFEKLRS